MTCFDAIAATQNRLQARDQDQASLSTLLSQCCPTVTGVPFKFVRSDSDRAPPGVESLWKLNLQVTTLGTTR
eukprot:146863-Hanusia_phi.AAC.1